MCNEEHPWQASLLLLDHAKNPRNNGWMMKADGQGYMQGECGDEMSVWIRADGDRIAHISFVTSGCGTSHAAGSMATIISAGRNLLEAMKITQEDVLLGLGGLPAAHEHCALLAATTVQLACEDVLVRRISINDKGIS